MSKWKAGHQKTQFSFLLNHRLLCTDLSTAASSNSTNRTVLSRGLMVCVVGRRLLSWLNREDTKFSSRITEMPACSSTAFRPASRTASITLYMSIRCTGMWKSVNSWNIWTKKFRRLPQKRSTRPKFKLSCHSLTYVAMLKVTRVDLQLHLFCMYLSLQAVRYVERHMASKFCSPMMKRKTFVSSAGLLCIHNRDISLINLRP